eukprot:4383888-Lingulodinium_polyedra.AAC.1
MFAVLRTKSVADAEELAGLPDGIPRFRCWDVFGKTREADPSSIVAQCGCGSTFLREQTLRQCAIST